jgi:site-specific recombinase XerD
MARCWLARSHQLRLRAAVDALLERAEAWRPPPPASDDGPPASDELLLIVLRSKRTDNTRAAYARELTLFFAFCERRGQAVYAVRAEHVEDYLALLADGGLAEASRARALAAIPGYYRRAVHEQALPANPCAFVARPTPAADTQIQARAISRAQATTLLIAARQRSPLHELLVCLLFFNGLRASEAAAARLADVDEQLLLSATTGRALTRQAIHGLVGRLARAAGVGQLSPHDLRATMVTLALDTGMPAARRPGLRSARRPAHHPPLRPRPPVAQPPRRLAPRRTRRRVTTVVVSDPDRDNRSATVSDSDHPRPGSISTAVGISAGRGGRCDVHRPPRAPAREDQLVGRRRAGRLRWRRNTDAGSGPARAGRYSWARPRDVDLQSISRAAGDRRPRRVPCGRDRRSRRRGLAGRVRGGLPPLQSRQRGRTARVRPGAHRPPQHGAARRAHALRRRRRRPLVVGLVSRTATAGRRRRNVSGRTRRAGPKTRRSRAQMVARTSLRSVRLCPVDGQLLVAERAGRQINDVVRLRGARARAAARQRGAARRAPCARGHHTQSDRRHHTAPSCANRSCVHPSAVTRQPWVQHGSRRRVRGRRTARRRARGRPRGSRCGGSGASARRG